MADDQPRIRPEVVQAVFSALTDMDPGKLAALASSGVTRAERKPADELYFASLLAGSDQQERRLDALRALIGDHELAESTGWSDLFDGLSPERAWELRGLYDALPDSARAEYDRRYGRPQDI